jgi:hypothetical protein
MTAGRTAETADVKDAANMSRPDHVSHAPEVASTALWSTEDGAAVSHHRIVARLVAAQFVQAPWC